MTEISQYEPAEGLDEAISAVSNRECMSVANARAAVTDQGTLIVDVETEGDDTIRLTFDDKKGPAFHDMIGDQLAQADLEEESDR